MVLHKQNYADAFGLQWKTYRKTQLDSYSKSPISYDRLRRCLGEELWSRLHAPPGVSVLEAGCGAGRFTEILLATPSAHVTSTDYSAAVEANQENCPQGDRHRVVQADIRSSPFAPGQFDVVLCLGVVQHTPSPEDTILKLFDQVKPGGWLVIDHYTYSLSVFTSFGTWIRPILKRLPPEAGMRWTQRIVKFFFPLHRAVRQRRILRTVLDRVSPMDSHFHTFPELDDRLHYELSLLDTHDTLTDYYKHRRTTRQIERALLSLGAVDIQCAYGGNGVEARCRKPTR